jgi:hypothetical protein
VTRSGLRGLRCSAFTIDSDRSRLRNAGSSQPFPRSRAPALSLRVRSCLLCARIWTTEHTASECPFTPHLGQNCSLIAGQASNPWGSVVPQCMHFRFDLPRDLFACSVLKSFRRSSRLSFLGLFDIAALLGVLRQRVFDRPRLLAFSPPSVMSSRRDLPGRCWGRVSGLPRVAYSPLGSFYGW